MFHLTMPSDGAPERAMIHATKALLVELPSIGAATAIEVSTHADGEDAIKWHSELDAECVARRLEACSGITCVKVRVALRCVDLDGHEFTIDNGMLFWAQLAEPTSPLDEPIEITNSLNTDVYLPTSWGDDRDNRAVAAHNAPRFNAFLAGYLRDSGAIIEDVSADDYPGQVGPDGIRLSDMVDATT